MSSLLKSWLAGGLWIGLLAATAAAAEDSPSDAVISPYGPQLGPSTTQQYRLGMVISAGGGDCKGIIGSAPVPTDWPEQRVVEVATEFSSQVGGVDFRLIAGTVKQMVVSVPFIAAGEEVQALITYEITRCPLLPPDDPTLLEIPKKLPREVRSYLGPSPGIESRHAKIKSLAKEVMATKETAWERVEAVYDWVRDKVEYRNGPFKGAAQALEDGYGDCEELTSLFIAMCRAQGVPARTVWVPGHCYPEFYLADAEGQGHWFPCQAAGSRSFGGIPEERPILQKGDNFTSPERPREKQRYLSEYLVGAGGKPKVKFIRELVGAGTPGGVGRGVPLEEPGTQTTGRGS